MSYIPVEFKNNKGVKLAGRLDMPIQGKPMAYVVFSHVFTGHKNLIGAKYISKALNNHGYAVLRFDFTGLGDSEGSFEETNFSTNVEDIEAAAAFLEANYEAPSILVGQSLGGAASVAAAHEIDAVKAVATIGAPSEAKHVMHLLGCHAEDIEKGGQAEVEIAGRSFIIKKQFLDDLYRTDLAIKTETLRKALLIMHSPQDEIVEIENAAKIYHAAYHPKSFVTLDGSDHMLSDKMSAHYAGEVISYWAKRYIDIDTDEEEILETDHQVVARLADDEDYTTHIRAGKHSLTADEPRSVGGNDFGPTPYGLLASALAACKAMTLQMYARRKKWPLEEVKVHVSFNRRHDKDCMECEDKGRYIEHFDTTLELEGNLDEAQQARLKEIADKCPVQKTLAGNMSFETRLKA